MSEDDKLIKLTEKVIELSSIVSQTAAEVERLKQEHEETKKELRAVRPTVETLARSETEATFRGLIMSWTNLSEKFGELYAEVHGAHGIERRLEEARLCLFGREGTNGLRGDVRLFRYALMAVGVLLVAMLGDKFGLYALRSLLPGP